MSQRTLTQFRNKALCPTCGRDDFDGKRGMRIHHKLAHGESLAKRRDQYRCPECGQEVETKRGLSNHLSKVHPKMWDRLQSEGMVLTVDRDE